LVARLFLVRRRARRKFAIAEPERRPLAAVVFLALWLQPLS
jgi:hypothetical protein